MRDRRGINCQRYVGMCVGMHICTYGFDPIQNLHYKGKSLNSAEDCEVSISAHILEEYTFMHVVCVCAHACVNTEVISVQIARNCF